MIWHNRCGRIKRLVCAGLWIDLLIVGVAFAFRVALLDIKPAHFDEGVNGWFVDQLAKEGLFRYDPTNYHGPLHFYVLFLSQTIFGRNLWALRMPVVLAGVATVALALAFKPFIGRAAARVAAIGLAVSPGFVFYNRYSIHESWLVLFLMLGVWGALGLMRSGGRGWLWPTVLGSAGAILTKETYAIHAVCFLLAWPTLLVLDRISVPGYGGPKAAARWRSRDLLAPIVLGLGAIFFFYTGNLYELPGITGLVETFRAWYSTGVEGKGHEKAWTYWLQLIARYEWPALLGLAGSLFVWVPGTPRLIRFFGIVGAGTLAAYSLVRYKTPWCAISIIWPLYFVLGHWAARLRAQSGTLLLALCLAPLVLASAALSARLNFFRFTDEKEPYVYVQTYRDIDRLLGPLMQVVGRDPTQYHMTGRIILESYYPIPWLLGDFTRIGYYDFEEVADPADAGFLLIDGERWRFLEKKLGQSYFVEAIKVRDAQKPARLYLNTSIFRGVYPGRKPDFPSAP
jgi:uncharacterized protein (TIGR03663 family)